MLVLSRKPGERIVIGEHIVLKVLRIEGGKIRLGIEAPDGVAIWRGELQAARAPQNKEAADEAAELCLT